MGAERTCRAPLPGIGVRYDVTTRERCRPPVMPHPARPGAPRLLIPVVTGPPTTRWAGPPTRTRGRAQPTRAAERLRGRAPLRRTVGTWPLRFRVRWLI